MKPWRTLDRRSISSHLPWLELQLHRVRLPGGDEIGDWTWVALPDFVNVAAVDAEGNFICFRQTKYAVPGVTLAVPGGYVDPGEAPRDAAARELEEETGYRSARITPLGSYVMDGNRGCGRGHLFLMESCTPTGIPVADDLEEQELILLSSDEVRKALLNGDFGVASWTATLALALLQRSG